MHSETITRLTGAQSASVTIMPQARLRNSQSPAPRTYSRFLLADAVVDASLGSIYISSLNLSRASPPPAVPRPMTIEGAERVKPAYLNVLAGVVMLAFIGSLVLLYVAPQSAVLLGILAFVGMRWVGGRSSAWRKANTRHANL
jgi:hypothetical protein